MTSIKVALASMVIVKGVVTYVKVLANDTFTIPPISLK